MGDGGEGEDEVQFLRTVRTCVRGLWGCLSGSSERLSVSDVSVLIADSL